MEEKKCLSLELRTSKGLFNLFMKSSLRLWVDNNTQNWLWVDNNTRNFNHHIEAFEVHLHFMRLLYLNTSRSLGFFCLKREIYGKLNIGRCASRFALKNFQYSRISWNLFYMNFVNKYVFKHFLRQNQLVWKNILECLKTCQVCLNYFRFTRDVLIKPLKHRSLCRHLSRWRYNYNAVASSCIYLYAIASSLSLYISRILTFKKNNHQTTCLASRSFSLS